MDFANCPIIYPSILSAFFESIKRKFSLKKLKTKYWYFLKFGGEVRLKSKKRMKVLKLLFGVATARLGETFARADHIGMQFMTNIIWAIIWVMWYDSYRMKHNFC